MDPDESTRYARLSASLLASQLDPENSRSGTPGERAKMVAAIEAGLRRRMRRRRLGRFVLGALGITTIAALAMALFGSP